MMMYMCSDTQPGIVGLLAEPFQTQLTVIAIRYLAFKKLDVDLRFKLKITILNLSFIIASF